MDLPEEKEQNEEKKDFLIPLTGRGWGKFILVDEEDYQWAHQFSWYPNSNERPLRRYYYEHLNIYGTISLSRDILNRIRGSDFQGKITFNNSNKLDYRRSNLNITPDIRAKEEIVVENNDTYVKMPIGCHGKTVLVDLEDYKYLSKHSWYETTNRGCTYAAARNKGKMHRVIMERMLGKPIQGFVTHISGDRLDNRRKNLLLSPPKNRNKSIPKNSKGRKRK